MQRLAQEWAQSLREWLGQRLGVERAETQRVTARAFIAQVQTQQQQLEARRAAEPVTPSCYSGGARNGGAFIEFRPDAHRRLGFPWAQLCHYTLEPNGGDTDAPERLTLAFSTANLVIVGARLAKLVEMINEHDLASVSVVDARHAGLLARAPWVASIVITRLDKQGGEA